MVGIGIVRRWARLLACGGSLLAVAVAAHGASASSKKAAPAAVKEPTEIRLAHTLGKEREEALRQLAERFNASSKEYRITVGEGDWNEGTPAHLMILQGEEMEEFLSGKPRYKPLHAVMREARVPFKATKAPSNMTRAAVDEKGRLLGLPVGLSTPVLYINRNAFQNVGLDPDAPLNSWFDLQQALGKLFAAGTSCPYTVSRPAQVMVENTSAWHNEPVSARSGKTEALSFNGMLQVKHVAMMASWYRARYLHIFEGEDQAEQSFVSGKCAVIAAPSASWTAFRRGAGFDMRIAPLPYHDDYPGAPQNTLADGPVLWVAAGKKPAEYKAVARFVAFWLQPESQLAWQRDSGYLPLNQSGVLAVAPDGAVAPDLDNVKVAVSQLTRKPATADSSVSSLFSRSRVRAILDEELQAVWADRKPAKEALDTALVRARSALTAVR